MPTIRRGLVAIHAAKREPVAAMAWGYTEPAYTCLKEIGCYNLKHLPRGAILGVVVLSSIANQGGKVRCVDRA